MKIFQTSSGFSAEINDKATEDWRLYDAVSDTQSENAGKRLLGVRQICILMLGQSGYDALKKHIAAPDGSISVQDMEREILEIFGALGESSKN